jgi:lipopolysaccharide heptosyltransferase I
LDKEALRRQDFGRILLIKLSALGDVVHSIPVLHKLRRRYPDARIDWLVAPAFAELLTSHPALSRLVLFGREERSSPWTALARSARLEPALRAARYDLVLDLQGQFRSAALALATRAPVRLGFDRPRREVWAASPRTLPAEARRHAWKGAREGAWLAYTHRIPVPTLDVHAVDRYLRLAPMLGLDEDTPDFSFPIPRHASERVERLLRRHADGGVLTIAPGTAWETKHWHSQGFAEVARHFLRQGFTVALVGSRREQHVCAEVAAAAPGSLNLAGETSLSELAALLGRSALCVTNDSGPMHLAVALNRPLISIFGPTDEIWVGPYRRRGAVVRAELACAPCYLRLLSRCPHDHACMRRVSAQAVIERAELVLAASDSAREPVGSPH